MRKHADILDGAVIHQQTMFNIEPLVPPLEA